MLNPRHCCYEMVVAICCRDCDGRYFIIHYIHRIMAYTLQDKMHSASGPSHERGWPRKTIDIRDIRTLHELHSLKYLWLKSASLSDVVTAWPAWFAHHLPTYVCKSAPANSPHEFTLASLHIFIKKMYYIKK